MSNFNELLSDALSEKQKTFKDLEDCGIISKRSHYQFKTYTPFLLTVINIANYLEVSLDYLAGRTNINTFKKYSVKQNNFYDKLIHMLKISSISQSKLANDIKIGRTNFTYWKNGSLPKLSTLIDLAEYFGCSIDDFLDLD